MGDAADDMYDAEERLFEETLEAERLGIKPCPLCKGSVGHPMLNMDVGCPRCEGLGWLDKDGRPTEL